MHNFNDFLAENGQHPDFNTDFVAALAYHRKLVAFCGSKHKRRTRPNETYADELPAAYLKLVRSA